MSIKYQIQIMFSNGVTISISCSFDNFCSYTLSSLWHHNRSHEVFIQLLWSVIISFICSPVCLSCIQCFILILIKQIIRDFGKLPRFGRGFQSFSLIMASNASSNCLVLGCVRSSGGMAQTSFQVTVQPASVKIEYAMLSMLRSS